MASGPALEVISKMLARGAVRGGGRGMGGGRGGFGGNQHTVAISEMDSREISMVKNKLRGAKVSQLPPQMLSLSGHS
jgi:hypothetical protein